MGVNQEEATAEATPKLAPAQYSNVNEDRVTPSADANPNNSSKLQNVITTMKQWKEELGTLRASTEQFIEDPGTILFFLLLAYADILLGSLQLHGTNVIFSMSIDTLREVTLYSLMFELSLQCIIFRTRFFSHWGYLVECGIIAGRFLQTNQHQLHLLSFLRIWRSPVQVNHFITDQQINGIITSSVM